MEGEKQLSILYQKQGRAIQFSSKAARDKCLQKEIDDLERVLSSSLAQSDAVFNHHKSQRDKLQDEHKSLWKNETELSAEIEKQIAAVEKAEKCLDHATAGEFPKV
ncbi:PREDICTED: structural maintenance of chromosomes [Prunus dulcis]|uniref:PREDICTED: structural maintenance of chromosomes n=1 Tax=Prunus dulcis TaxID=3755 RepID=A0A5E4GN24_PRUDU|nr:PREDICTED: structural maintenance of chromosomes [Prunus dulcis]